MIIHEALLSSIELIRDKQRFREHIIVIGSTEAFHIFLSNRLGDIRPESSGKPHDGYALKLVDEEGKEVPKSEIGNLLV